MFLKVFSVCILFSLFNCHHRFRHRKVAAVKTALAGTLYEVQTGDTLHSIAEKKQVSTFDLMEVNGIVNSKELKVGQKLYIPESELPLVYVPLPKSSTHHNPSPVLVGHKINLAWPVKNGVILRDFDTHPKSLNEGMVFGAPENTTVRAAADGEVVYIGDDQARYGRIIIIKHADPFVTIYAHLGQVAVSKGQKVKQKAPIGTVGVSGGVDSPRLYFQVRQQRTPVDPELYLRKSLH